MPRREGWSPFEVPGERRTNDAVEPSRLRPGATQLSVRVTKDQRARMNRVKVAAGLSIPEQVRRALESWLSHMEGRHA